MAESSRLQCSSRSLSVTIVFCVAFVVIAISCLPETVRGNHVPPPGARNSNAVRGRNARPEALPTSQRRRGSSQQLAASRGATNSRSFAVQNARAASQQRVSPSRRPEQWRVPPSRTRTVGNSQSHVNLYLL